MWGSNPQPEIKIQMLHRLSQPGTLATWFFKHQKAKSWGVWGKKEKSFIKIFLWGLEPCLPNWVIQHQCFHLRSFNAPCANEVFSLSGCAVETEAQRDQVIYQIQATLEVGFKPQCVMKNPFLGHVGPSF